MMCFEMGLSSFGDNFAWLKRFLAGTMKTLLAGKVSAEVLAEAEDKILPSLAEAASKLPFREDAPFASDWFNGRRSPDPNPSLRATVSGLGLATDAADVYYAIVEATAFGVKAMVDTLVDNGVALESITAIGGIAVKSPFIVQFLADVLGMEIFVPNLTQACGLGAAINASVASGCWPGLLEAQEAMCVTEGVRYTPSSARDFSRRYERYRNM
jgi:L-ribulokinase